MRRALRWAARILAALVLVPLILLAAGAAWLNTPSGHRYVANLVARITSGELVARGLSGNLFAAPRFEQIEVRDSHGVFAVVHGLAIRWSPTALLRRDVKVTRLAAEAIELRRRPVASAGSKQGSSSWYGFRLDVDEVRAERVALAPPVVGVAAALSAEGNLHLASAAAGRGSLSARRLDAPGSYRAAADFSPDRIAAELSAEEPPAGLIASAADLPDIGALSMEGRLAGPLSGASAMLLVQAGELHANGKGSIDLKHGVVALDLSAAAPAMRPRPDLAWRSVALAAHVQGPYSAPSANGNLAIAELSAAGASVARLTADLGGNTGQLQLTARAEGVRVPGAEPELLAGSPLVLTAQLALAEAGRPLGFTLEHKLLTAKGTAETSTPIHGQIVLDLPDLAPLARAANADLRGHSALQIGFAQSDAGWRLNAGGSLAITGGLAQAVSLIGPPGHVALDGVLSGSSIRVSEFRLNGQALQFLVNGQLGPDSLDLAWKGRLPDLRAAVTTLTGGIQAEGSIAGSLSDLSVNATASGEVGAQGVPRGPVRVALALHGLPKAPVGRISAEGELDRAPLALVAEATRAPDGTIRLGIQRADWKSAHAEGALVLRPGANIPDGRIAFRMARLADVRPFIGMALSGSLDGSADFTRERAQLRAEARGAQVAGTEIASAVLAASIANPATNPIVDASLAASGIRTAALSGSGRIDVHGPEERLGVQLAAKLDRLAGAPADIGAAGVVNAKAKELRLASLAANWKAARLRLLAPARIAFGADKIIDHLRLGLGQAQLEANGRLEPTLDLRFALANVTPELLRTVMPTLPRSSGTVGGTAQLRGTLDHPIGTARLTAAGIHMASGPGEALPAADFSANAELDGRTVRLDARLGAGPATQLALTGTAGLALAAPIDLRASGGFDLAMLNPLTEASGRRVRGRVSLAASVGGTLDGPRMGGTAQLSNGEVDDFAQGIHLTDIAAMLQGSGTELKLAQFSARAGGGTIAGSGSVGVLAPGIPLALRLTMNGAKPLASNLLSATIDADLSLTGAAERELRAAGTIGIRRADINVPEHMPQGVAVLPVRIAGEPPPPPPAPGPNIALDLNLSAPGKIFVRGRGLNAELGGTLHVGGTAKNPAPSGGFKMIRGQFSLAGTTLDFSEGDITFSGRGNIGPAADRIDPALHFVATSTSASVTATLTVGGYASDPKITLSSVPQLPQDEILAQLLFGQSIKNLSPFQVAEIGSTLAELGGLTSGGIGDPLNRLRNTLGLDRLTIGTNPYNPAITPGTQENNTNTVVQAGRYVAPGVYVGALQSVSGVGQQTEANVQADLTKHLKLQTGVGSGPGANNIGLLYQFQY